MASGADVKQKIAGNVETMPKFQFVADSLADPSLGIPATDETIRTVDGKSTKRDSTLACRPRLAPSGTRRPQRALD